MKLLVKKLLVANWKMQLSHDQACSWIETELPSVQEVCATTPHELVICPSFTTLSYGTTLFPDSSWGAQTVGFEKQGAYTGDVSVLSLKELGVQYCLVGHSEQRRYRGVTDEQVAQKVALLRKQGIQPIVCIGETVAQKHETKKILQTQLEQIIGNESLIIAYEPVWSIGTGDVPSPEQLAQSVAIIKNLCGSQTRILYGGSVTDTKVALFGSYVEGFLIGSASLDADRLKKIILSC